MLETLVNELLFEVFDYFTVSHLLRAFRFLNSRFDQLIVFYLHNCHHIDLRSISKWDFDFICQHHLHSLSSHISSLTLSNDDESPQQIQLFLSHGFTLHQFTHLRSLSLYEIPSERMTIQILAQCRDLSQLTHLSLIKCWLEDLDSIWCLPKLCHLYLDIIFARDDKFVFTYSMSSCLQTIILNRALSLYSLFNILEHSSHLRRLHAHLSLTDNFVLNNSHQFFPSIVTLQLTYIYDHIGNSTQRLEVMEMLLRLMPNLRSLTVETSSILINGYDWERLITGYLPMLNKFRLKMEIYTNNIIQIQEQIDNVFRSFQSHFWLYQHQWFIQCCWDLHSIHKCRVLFYTLPYMFSNLFISNGRQWYKSTCPYADNRSRSFNQVHIVHYESCLFEHDELYMQTMHYRQSNAKKLTLRTRFKNLFSFSSSQKNKSYSLSTTQMIPFNRYFFNSSIIPHVPNIRQLTIRLPFDVDFWSITPALDQLRYLDVFLTAKCTDASQLQLLLDRAPHLYSLTFGYDATLTGKISLANFRSLSVRMLNLRGSESLHRYSSYSNAQCVQLSRSQLGKQCEVLIISVKHQRSILYLVNKLLNLRALNVRCKDDPYVKTGMVDAVKFVRWLQSHLSSTVVVERDDNDYNGSIRLWIRR